MAVRNDMAHSNFVLSLGGKNSPIVIRSVSVADGGQMPRSS